MEPPRPRVDRRLLLGGAGVVGVLVGLLVLLPLFSGDSDDVTVGIAPGPAAASSSTTTTTTVPVRPAADVVPAVAATQDPFRQIVTVPQAPQGAQGGPAVVAAQTPAPEQPAPAAPSTPPPSAAEAAPPTPPTTQAPPPDLAPTTTLAPLQPSAASTPPPAVQPGNPTESAFRQPATREISLELFGVSRDGEGVERAHLNVDGHYYSPTEAELFSPYGLRLDIDGDCVEVWKDHDRIKMCLPAPATR